MSASHQFGGRWTEEKLGSLRGYLQAYRTIFNANPKASKLNTIYVDAFAGTGYRNISQPNQIPESPLFIDDNQIYDDEIKKAVRKLHLKSIPHFTNIDL